MTIVGIRYMVYRTKNFTFVRIKKKNLEIIGDTEFRQLYYTATYRGI